MNRTILCALAFALTLSAAPAYADPPEAQRSVVPAVVLGVVGAGAIAASIGLMALSSAHRTEAEAVRLTLVSLYGDCVPGYSNFDTKLCADLADKVHRQQAFQNAALGTVIAGGAAMAGALIYLLWPSQRVHMTPPIRVAPTMGGLVVTGRF